jgi:hypothetical protein
MNNREVKWLNSFSSSPVHRERADIVIESK